MTDFVVPDAGGARSPATSGAGAWWQTVRTERRVLVMVSTVTSAKRLLDIAGLFDDDLRVQLFFTIPPDIFNHGAARFLEEHGAPLMPWDQVSHESFDLAVTANFGHLDRIDAPVAVFSHGASRNSRARARGRGSIPVTGPVTGFSPADLVRAGMLVPSALALGHEQELTLLEAGCPEALPIASIVGDPCYDRITRDAALREEYRAALGVREDQTLVVATSTWRANSLFGSSPHLVQRLAGLPRPHYVPVLLTHPNIWAAHGSYQMRAWLSRATRAGLVVVPPQLDWQPFILAADLIIGDHGSVTLYGAATGRPVLLGAFPDRDVHPTSGAAVLGASVPRITDDVPLDQQLRHAVREFDPAVTAHAASLISSEPGAFARHTRRLLYRMLRSGQPAFEARLPPAERPSTLESLRVGPDRGIAA